MFDLIAKFNDIVTGHSHETPASSALAGQHHTTQLQGGPGGVGEVNVFSQYSTPGIGDMAYMENHPYMGTSAVDICADYDNYLGPNLDSCASRPEAVLPDMANGRSMLALKVLIAPSAVTNPPRVDE